MDINTVIIMRPTESMRLHLIGLIVILIQFYIILWEFVSFSLSWSFSFHQKH